MFQVAGIQLRPIMYDVEANIKRGLTYFEQAVDQGADLIVFPEMWTTGYYLSKESFLELAEPQDGNTVTLMQQMAAQTETAVIAPFVEKGNEDNCYISAAVIDSTGDLRGVTRKSMLWGREKQIFSQGQYSYPVFDSKVGKIGVLICYELEFPETARLLALEGVDIIVCPSVWSVAANHRWDIQLPGRALDNTVYVLGVNNVGNNACGKTKLVSPLGDILAEASDRKEEVLIQAIDPEALKWAREEIGYLADFPRQLTPGGEKVDTPTW